MGDDELKFESYSLRLSMNVAISKPIKTWLIHKDLVLEQKETVYWTLVQQWMWEVSG